MKALIAGAGIGGLTAAFCLPQAGVEVFELADAVRELSTCCPPASASWLNSD